MTKEDEALREIMEIAGQLGPTIFAALDGRDPVIADGVFAYLMAFVLAGESVPHDRAATAKLREDLLADHIDRIRKLIPICEQIAMERMQPQGRG